MPTITFLKTGLQPLIQDMGRQSFQAQGIPVGGVMDVFSAKLANDLVGNPSDAPVLEIPLMGPTLEIKGDCQIALTGADMNVLLDNQPIKRYETINVLNQGVLQFGRLTEGARAYLAIGGNWNVKKWLGSYSAASTNATLLTPGSIFTKNAVLDISHNPFIVQKNYPVPTFDSFPTIRVLEGVEFERFSRKTIAQFFGQTHEISNDSNRMGYRLNTYLKDYQSNINLISSGIVKGTVQISQAGQPIVLMADAQTTGGYPRIANVIALDIDKLAQLKAKDKIRFELISLEDAQQLIV